MLTGGTSSNCLVRSEAAVEAASSRVPASRLATFCVAFMVASRSIHTDLPRSCRLATLNADMQDPIAVGGVDPIGIDIVGQCDYAPELPGKPLLPVVIRSLVGLELACPGHCQQVLLQGHIQALRVDARREQIDMDLIGGRAHIQRREGPPLCGANARRPRRVAEQLIDLAFEPAELLIQAIALESSE